MKSFIKENFRYECSQFFRRKQIYFDFYSNYLDRVVCSDHVICSAIICCHLLMPCLMNNICLYFET